MGVEGEAIILPDSDSAEQHGSPNKQDEALEVTISTAPEVTVNEALQADPRPDTYAPQPPELQKDPRPYFHRRTRRNPDGTTGVVAMGGYDGRPRVWRHTGCRDHDTDR